MPRTSKGIRTNRSHKPQTIPAKFKPGFLAELDGRTELARLLRANCEAVVNDVGGPEDISHVKAALIERFVWLEAILQCIEHEMGTGKCDKLVALGKWVQAVNSLSGLAKVLGVERNANARPWLIPVDADNNGHDNDEQEPSP